MKLSVQTELQPDLGNNFHLNIVFEGGENKEQFALLRSYGVKYYQGYYFSRLVDLDTFELLIQTPGVTYSENSVAITT